MSFLVLFHSVSVGLMALALFFMTNHSNTLSFLLGGLFSGAIVFSTMLLVQSILGKKSVAWSISVIVLKYAFIGFIFYQLVWKQRVDFLFFSAGLIWLVLTTFATGLYLQKKQTVEDP